MNTSAMSYESKPAFRQSGLRVEKLDEFEHLQSGLHRVFSPNGVEGFLQLLRRKGVPIRDFDRILRERLLEASGAWLPKDGRSAKQLYEALSVSDQSQIRELYLTVLEDVGLSLREKYNNLYRYY